MWFCLYCSCLYLCLGACVYVECVCVGYNKILIKQKAIFFFLLLFYLFALLYGYTKYFSRSFFSSSFCLCCLFILILLLFLRVNLKSFLARYLLFKYTYVHIVNKQCIQPKPKWRGKRGYKHPKRIFICALLKLL